MKLIAETKEIVLFGELRKRKKNHHEFNELPVIDQLKDAVLLKEKVFLIINISLVENWWWNILLGGTNNML